MNAERVERLKAIALDTNNTKVINKVIEYINIKLNIDLYKEYNSKEKIKKIDLKKNKAFYKQVIQRLFNHLERNMNKKNRLFKLCEQGQEILEMKRASTVQSPNYGSEAGKQTNGYHANTQEAKLLDIEEETIKQRKRLIEYQKFSDELDQDKELLEKFIELSPNNTAVDVINRHYFLGERFCDIAADICYSEVYYIVKRGIDDLAQILESSL